MVPRFQTNKKTFVFSGKVFFIVQKVNMRNSSSRYGPPRHYNAPPPGHLPRTSPKVNRKRNYSTFHNSNHENGNHINSIHSNSSKRQKQSSSSAGYLSTRRISPWYPNSRPLPNNNLNPLNVPPPRYNYHNHNHNHNHYRNNNHYVRNHYFNNNHRNHQNHNNNNKNNNNNATSSKNKEKTWNCETCTYENSSHLNKCEMCQHEKSVMLFLFYWMILFI